MKRTGSIGSRVGPEVMIILLNTGIIKAVAVNDFCCRQSSFAGFTVGQQAFGGFDDFNAPALQAADIFAYRRVFQHVGIHGRSQDHPFVKSSKQGGQKVVSDAVGHFAYDVGRGRSHQQ